MVVLGLIGPLKQYFSLYRAVSQREGERGKKRKKRVKMFKQLPPAPTASAVSPCPTVIQIVVLGFEVGMKGLNVSISEHCLAFYFYFFHKRRNFVVYEIN